MFPKNIFLASLSKELFFCFDFFLCNFIFVTVLVKLSRYSTTLPYKFVYNEWTQCRVFNNYEKSATLVSNSQSFNRPLNDCIEKAWRMFNAGAFVHQYERYGLTENDFIDSFAVTEQIFADYSAI